MGAAPRPEVVLRGYRPGDLGRVTLLHARYYHRHWGLDRSFECQVARELAEFLTRLDPTRDLFTAAEVAGRFAGAIALDGADPQGARLRWFIVDPRHQGQGLGRRLLDHLLAFASQAGHRRIHLWTFAGLEAARHLYQEAGFVLVEEHAVQRWGRRIREQRYLWRNPSHP
jgi:GNAT superfamily N-acetyltransferase